MLHCFRSTTFYLRPTKPCCNKYSPASVRDDWRQLLALGVIFLVGIAAWISIKRLLVNAKMRRKIIVSQVRLTAQSLPFG